MKVCFLSFFVLTGQLGCSYRTDVVAYAGILLALFSGQTAPLKHYLSNPLPPLDFPWVANLVQLSLDYLRHNTQDIRVPDMPTLMVEIERNFVHEPRIATDPRNIKDMEQFHKRDPELPSVLWRLDSALLRDKEVGNYSLIAKFSNLRLGSLAVDTLYTSIKSV